MNPLESRTPGWHQAFAAERTLPCDKWEHYFSIYDECFGHLYGQNVNYLEIGVQRGGSLEISRRLFGPGSFLAGVDIDPSCAILEGYIADRMIIGSQADPIVLQAIRQLGKTFDLIIDDGSHHQDHMIISFIELFTLLRPGGIYLIEDTHSVFSQTHQDGFFGLNVYDFFNGLNQKLCIDYCNFPDIDGRFTLPPDQRPSRRPQGGLTRFIHSIRYFNSIIEIRRSDERPEPMRRVR